jgi:putative endonuclease
VVRPIAAHSDGLKWIPGQARDDEAGRGEEEAMAGHVYIMASARNGTLYVGVTSDLSRRVYEHKTHALPGFTSRYGCTRLVWYEEHFDMRDAISREKTIKRWRREWKVELIETMNPDWNELYTGIGW